MASYHITDDGPRACSTTPDRCPYGREGGEHFDNVAEAQVGYEKIMEARFGLEGATRAAANRGEELYRLHDKLDRLERDNANYKRIAQVANYSRIAPSKNPRLPYRPSGRSRGYDRMKKSHLGPRVSKMAVRRGQQLFASVGPTPRNIIKLHRLLTKEVEDLGKRW